MNRQVMRVLISLTVLLLFLSACVDAQNKVADKKVLIVYLSRTSNTKAIAQIIQKNVGGVLVAVEQEKPYPTDYKATVDKVAHENETSYLPPLKTKIGNIEKYDVVFVGFPTWGMQLPPTMKSFLNEHNLSGKTVIPFNTNGGYGVGSSFQTVKELCNNSRSSLSLHRKSFKMKNVVLMALMFISININAQEDKNKKMKNVLVIGASGSLARYVIDTLQNVPDMNLTLLLRDKSRIANDTTNCTVVQANVMDYPKLKNAIAGQDIVYINLAGDLEAMTKNIVKAMQEKKVKRVIAISSIGIYVTPLKPVLIPYRKLADVIESSGLDYTILRPDWFTDGNEVDYAITKKGTPESGTAISRKSIAAFIANLIQHPDLHKNENLGISKPS